MRLLVICSAMALALIATAGPAAVAVAAQEKSIFPYAVRKTRLANGLDVISVDYDSPGIIAYYTVVRTGSRNEVEPGLSGFAHFFEHMMFRGTDRFSQEKYNDILKGLGADSNAFTTDDWTCYHITASAAALETIVELEADRFQNLKYSEADFQKEARAVLGEYNKSASSPMLLLDEKLQDLAYQEHPYKHTTIGFLDDIKNMPNQYSYSQEFFQRWYKPDNCIVLVVGDVQHSELVELVKKHYGGWKGKSADIEIPAEPRQTAEHKLDLTWPGRTLPYLVIGYHVPGFDPTDREVAALDILSEAVFSETSALYRKLVLEERKVELIDGGAPFRRDPTLFTVLARMTAEEHIDGVRQEIDRALEATAREPIPDERLEAIKSHMRYAFAMGLDSADAVARTMGEFLQLTGDPASVNQMYETYELVTAEDVQKVAARYLVAKNRTVITLRADQRSPAASDELQESLCEGVPSTLQQSENRRQKPASSETIMINDSPLVAIRLLYYSGTMDDPAGREGLAALTARLLTEGGTKRYSYDEILDRLYPMAAEMAVHCDKEVTTFSFNTHRDKLAEFYDLFSEMLTAPRFDPEDFERLREEQLNYVSTTLRGNNDESFGKWALQLMLYPRQHPYGHVDAGTISGLQAITLDDVKDFYQRHYAPLSAHVQLGIAGGADEPIVSRMRRDFRSLPAPSLANSALPEPHRPEGIELNIIKKDCIATAISIGFPLDLTRADDDFYALALASSAFGEHRTFNGRLMRNMRGKRGLNYGDYAYIENFIQDGGSTFPISNIPRRQQYFSIWIRPVPHDKALFALRQAVRELDLLVAHGLTQEEFEMTRDFLLNYSKLWVQTQSRRLGYEMDGAFYGRASLVTELDRRLPELTREQVNAAIKKYLQPNHLCVAVITADAEKLQSDLIARRPSPIQYDTEGTPQEVLQEDKLIEVYPLRVDANSIRITPANEMFE